MIGESDRGRLILQAITLLVGEDDRLDPKLPFFANNGTPQIDVSRK
jgi:hypothetical protein